MSSPKKHVLDYFQKDSWRVRLTVCVLRWIFLLALAALLSEKIAASPWLTYLLRRIV